MKGQSKNSAPANAAKLRADQKRATAAAAVRTKAASAKARKRK